MRNLIDAFFEITPTLVEELREAIDHGDAGRVREVAHELKSSSRNLGAVAFSDLCGRLEAHAREGSTKDADQTLAAMDQELRRVERVLVLERT
jgi:HPt (histidine-containing phosphotransfer) domain-containing protein